MQPIALGPVRGRYTPDYRLEFFRNGDPHQPITESRLNLRSLVSLQTAKNINDLAGTFQIVLKDGRARHLLREMDTVRIRLRGHRDGRYITVLKGVVDDVTASGSADVAASSEDTTISGRCAAKYLQVTSLFLPVWDPEALLPTALTFGLGDAAKKVGGNRPYDIFRYLVRKYTYGEKAIAGLSGVPNSRYWLDHHTRFGRSSVSFQVPYLQLDENSVGEALKRLEVLGFTEAWVDELGRIVYRHPQWDAPVAYRVSTNDLVDWSLNRTDVDAATYVEVIPAGDPGIDSATAQALRAGRAPIPSSYLRSAEASYRQSVTPSMVIQTDSKGHPTARGQRNHWYKLQRRLGLRPMQVTSPLIFTQQQAQAQAEGLLRFQTRMAKGGTIVLPGAPEVRLGYNLLLHGELDGVAVRRTYYIEGVQHTFVWGSHYQTTVTVTHGRDPWDPAWRQIALPKFDPAKLSQDGGVLDPSSSADVTLTNGPHATINADGTASAPRSAPAVVKQMIAAANRIIAKPYVWGGGHARMPDPEGYDCSGSTQYVLRGGALTTGVAPVSGQFGKYGIAGHGDWVTIFYNDDHVFIRVAGLNFDTRRMADRTPDGSGPRWQKYDVNAAGFHAVHPEGL